MKSNDRIPQSTHGSNSALDDILIDGDPLGLAEPESADESLHEIIRKIQRRLPTIRRTVLDQALKDVLSGGAAWPPDRRTAELDKSLQVVRVHVWAPLVERVSFHMKGQSEEVVSAEAERLLVEARPLLGLLSPASEADLNTAIQQWVAEVVDPILQTPAPVPVHCPPSRPIEWFMAHTSSDLVRATSAWRWLFQPRFAVPDGTV